jgi:hypothetical protein
LVRGCAHGRCRSLHPCPAAARALLCGASAPTLLPPLLPAAGLEDVTLGGLEDLSRAGKGGMDPNGLGASRLASDVLWSDPVGEPGFQPNLARGVGMCFGPDVTERFLAENGLRLVLRSHEGPDAREGRDDMQPMSGGYTLDHDTPAGKLMTVFRWVRGGVAGAVGLGRVGDGCAPSLLPKCTDSVHHQESCSSVCP